MEIILARPGLGRGVKKAQVAGFKNMDATARFNMWLQNTNRWISKLFVSNANAIFRGKIGRLNGANALQNSSTQRAAKRFIMLFNKQFLRDEMPVARCSIIFEVKISPHKMNERRLPLLHHQQRQFCQRSLWQHGQS